MRESKECADHDDYSLVHMSKAIGWKHNAEFASCWIYRDKRSPAGYSQPGSCYLLAQRSEHGVSEPSVLR